MLLNAGSLLYGTITVAALLAAESATSETYAETVGAVALAMLVYWLAHAYSEFTGDRLAHKRAATLEGLSRALVREVTILAGASIPFVTLVICWIAQVRLSTALNAATLASAVMIVAIEVVAGLRAELTRRQLAAQSAIGALFGLLVIALRLVLH